MVVKRISHAELLKYNITLFVPDDATNIFLYFDKGIPIGYASLIKNRIEAFEIFKEYQNNNYGYDVLDNICSYIGELYNRVELVPVEQWLISYYEKYGFVNSYKYTSNLDEYTLMFLNL